MYTYVRVRAWKSCGSDSKGVSDRVCCNDDLQLKIIQLLSSSPIEFLPLPSPNNCCLWPLWSFVISAHACLCSRVCVLSPVPHRPWISPSSDFNKTCVHMHIKRTSWHTRGVILTYEKWLKRQIKLRGPQGKLYYFKRFYCFIYF